jgi:glutathione synthase/RimK-type ligase-like ATP-grasp enzyme
MPVLILPYKRGSTSAKALSDRLGARQMKVEGSTLKNSDKNTIINWGNSTADLSALDKVRVINPQVPVAKASNKLKFFEAVSSSEEPISIPLWTTDKEVAQGWLSDGTDVVVRHRLQGHSGDGIQMVYHEDLGAVFPDAPLYVAYVKKRDEYRVHVVGGTVTDVQRKARRSSTPLDAVNWQIRNHSNGFVFVRERVDPPQVILSDAVKAVQTLGLDFGAVDVIWNQNLGKSYVIEVNTACGIEGTTLDRYTAALHALLAGEQPTEWQVGGGEWDIPSVGNPRMETPMTRPLGVRSDVLTAHESLLRSTDTVQARHVPSVNVRALAELERTYLGRHEARRVESSATDAALTTVPAYSLASMLPDGATIDSFRRMRNREEAASSTHTPRSPADVAAMLAGTYAGTYAEVMELGAPTDWPSISGQSDTPESTPDDWSETN